MRGAELNIVVVCLLTRTCALLITDRPSKIAKTSDESKEEEKEKADAVDDPPVEKDDCGPGGEDCGTDKGSSDDPPTDDGDATKESETKENDPKPTDPLADDTKTEEEAQVAAVTPSTEPSGLPNTAVDLTEQATVVNPDSVLEERAELDRMLVGRVIGKGGEQIRDLNVSTANSVSGVNILSRYYCVSNLFNHLIVIGSFWMPSGC